MATQTLLLLRHAQTEDSRPGHGDVDRRLTPAGEAQARAVGAALAETGLVVDTVLCSAAVRTRQTLDLLGLSEPARTDTSRNYYDAGADTLLDAVRALPDEAACVLLVGHAPGLPAVGYELADPAISDPAALAAIDGRFPAATVVRLELTGAWADLESAALVAVRLP